MHDLTPRQSQILKFLIEEYIKTAEPVGSETLEKKSNIGVSPATLRNEMVRLAELGFLRKAHSSAGRIPTPLGMKFYVNELMKEQEIPVAEEVAVKEKIWDYRNEFQKLIREATKTLAQKTKTLAVASTDEGDIFSAGTAYILDMPEFYDIDVTKSFLHLLDRFEYLQGLCDQELGEEDIHVLIGDELGNTVPAHYGFVYSKFHAGNHNGVIGVLGPARLNYPYIIPTIRTYGDLIEEVLGGW